MKTRSTLAFASAVLFATAFPLSAAPAAAVAHAHPVKFVERTSSNSVTRGSSRYEVEHALGRADATLGADVWVYRNFSVPGAPDCSAGCNQLLITFTGQTVSDIKLVNDRAEKIFAARIRDHGTEKSQVAAK